MKYRNISKNNTRAAVLTLVLAVTLLLTTTFSVAFLHGNAASLQEKKTGWYAMQKDAVDLGFNGVLQNKFGSWFVEDGKVNFGYTGWLVCEGTYYYVTTGRCDRKTPSFAIAKTPGKAGTSSGAKAGSNSASGTDVNSSTSNGSKTGNTKAGANTTGSNANQASESGNTNNNQTSGAKVTTKAPATTKAAGTTKKAQTTKNTTAKPQPQTKAPTQSSSSDIPVTLDEDELPIIAD